MKMFVAEGSVSSTKLFDSRLEAYDAFLREHDIEPLRIMDVTGGEENALVAWRSTEDI